MAYLQNEWLRRNGKLRYAADEFTPAVAADAGAEIQIFTDERFAESEGTNTLEEGNRVVARALWTPQDTFAGGATGPTINVNRRTPAGVGAAPAAAPTAALSGTAGNVTLGSHLFAFTYVVAGVETPLSAASNSTTAIAGSNQVNLTGVTAGPTGTTARRIYGTLAGTTGPYFLVGEVLDNTTTTFTVNVADPTDTTLAQELVLAPAQVILVATYTFSTNNNAVAWQAVPLTLSAQNNLYLRPGEALTFQIVQNSTGQALTGGRVFVDIDPR